MRHRVLGALTLVFLVGLFGCGSVKINKDYKPDPVPPGIPVGAAELAAAFAADKEAAKAKYGGQPVEADGVIRSITNIPQSQVRIVLGGKDGSGKPVECVFFMASEVAVSEGQAATIWGRCTDDGKLSACFVKKAEPDPATKVGAAELAKEYAADAKAAAKKYEGKALIVEGTVRDVQKRDGRPTFIFEGANDGTPRAVNVVADASARMSRDKLIEGVKKGGKWSFRGKVKGFDKGEVYFAQPFLMPQPEE